MAARFVPCSVLSLKNTKISSGGLRIGYTRTVVDEAGRLVGDGARLALFCHIGNAALRGEAGELRAVHTTATATLDEAAHMSETEELHRGLDPGDAAGAGAHGTCLVHRKVDGQRRARVHKSSTTLPLFCGARSPDVETKPSPRQPHQLRRELNIWGRCTYPATSKTVPRCSVKQPRREEGHVETPQAAGNGFKKELMSSRRREVLSCTSLRTRSETGPLGGKCASIYDPPSYESTPNRLGTPVFSAQPFIKVETLKHATQGCVEP